MTFTDDDLKSFKNCIDYKGPLLDQFHKLPALLSRLEAVEKYVELSPCDPDIHADQYAAYKAWRKACGK